MVGFLGTVAILLDQNQVRFCCNDSVNLFPPLYLKVFFCDIHFEFNRFNQYRKYRNRIRNLLTSINYCSQNPASTHPTLVRVRDMRSCKLQHQCILRLFIAPNCQVWGFYDKMYDMKRPYQCQIWIFFFQ